VPLLVRHGQLARAPAEIELAAEQVVRFMRAVQDPSGLVTHAFSERDGAVVTEPPLAARVFWLRGQGWVLASGIEVWAALPEDHPLRVELAERLQRLAGALIAQQSATGLFHTLVDRASTYKETAGSALVIAALSHGARAGLFDVRARAAAERGMRGLLAILVQDGERSVPGTSLGTNPWPAIYELVPTAPQVSYGVGAFLLAACELSRLLDS
jgi:unsaturated rhamnogalacturonyl hydrolase